MAVAIIVHLTPGLVVLPLPRQGSAEATSRVAIGLVGASLPALFPMAALSRSVQALF